MNGLPLPEGYSLERATLKKKLDKEGLNIEDIEYTILRRGEKMVFYLPTKHCSPQRIEGVIRQIQGAEKTEP